MGTRFPFRTPRSCVFVGPYCLRNVRFPLDTPWIASTLLLVIMAGAYVSTVYLVTFNRRTRQGLHDLAVDSFVANANQTGPLDVQPVWKPHWGILGVILAACLSIGILVGTLWSDTEPFSWLIEADRPSLRRRHARSALGAGTGIANLG
jgi:hypothetical protein